MLNWTFVFDEAYPVTGASLPDLDRFVATVGQSVTPSEVKAINRGQQNPFPKGDPLHSSWRRFDPSLWVIPNRPLPASYLALLSWSNGGEFRSGERWFQFFPIFETGNNVRAMLLAYHLPQYMPGALPFAFNGGGAFYLFDMRRQAKRGEYPVVCCHAGHLGWAADSCWPVAGSFEDACRGKINVEGLREGRTSV
jgi:hypothetical protein